MPKGKEGKAEKPPKKSPTAFQLWSKDNRDEVKKSVASDSFGDIQKALAEKWKTVDAANKESFEKKAAQLKITYQKELAKWKDANPGASVRKSKDDKKADKEGKKKRKKKDPNAPKRPLSAYFLWMNEHRESTKAANPSATFGGLGKILAEKWNALDEAAKEPWQKKATAAKADYEGQLAAYKAAGGGASPSSSPKKSKTDTKKRETKKEGKKETKKESSEEESEKSESSEESESD